MPNQKQLSQIVNAPGFIAALDQSGGSTPKALAAYGVTEKDYANETEMFDQMHAMRSRIMEADCFDNQKVIGAILFERTIESMVQGKAVSEYLWNERGVVPFLKVDKGLQDEANGVQLMIDNPDLSKTLSKANSHNIFGTKMRSVIHSANQSGIADIVDQQFEVAKEIIAHGLCPIIEPEINIISADKSESEEILHSELVKALGTLNDDQNVMLKVSLPTKTNHYQNLMNHPRIVRIVALSGGYSSDEASKLLSQNTGMIASFSRALTEGLQYQMSGDEFESALNSNITTAFKASIAG